jgi:hypothetical protein
MTGFGKEGRNDYEKRALSKEHQKLMPNYISKNVS